MAPPPPGRGAPSTGESQGTDHARIMLIDSDLSLQISPALPLINQESQNWLVWVHVLIPEILSCMSKVCSFFRSWSLGEPVKHDPYRVLEFSQPPLFE
jgi:hypothetical protein